MSAARQFRRRLPALRTPSTTLTHTRAGIHPEPRAMHNRGGCRSQWSHHRRPSELSKSVGASQSDASDTHVRPPPRRATCAPISGTQRLSQGHITHRGIPNARVPGYHPKRSHASLDKGPVATNAPSHPASSTAARCPSPRPVPAPAPAKLARLATSTDRKAGPEAPRPTHGRATDKNKRTVGERGQRQQRQRDERGG